jgi:hypothetical protein
MKVELLYGKATLWQGLGAAGLPRDVDPEAAPRAVARPAIGRRRGLGPADRRGRRCGQVL